MTPTCIYHWHVVEGIPICASYVNLFVRLKTMHNIYRSLAVYLEGDGSAIISFIMFTSCLSSQARELRNYYNALEVQYELLSCHRLGMDNP